MKEVRGKDGFLSRDIGGTKLDMKAFTVMCSQFAIILRAGIPIARTVHLIADKTTDKVLKRILTQVADDVEAGRSISSSFEERGGKLLPATFVDTIRAGEETGSIDTAFRTMHRHLDKQAKMGARVRGALAYPVFVLFIAVIVVIVIMVKVVPTFTAIFESYGAELPGITKALIAISHFFGRYWLVMLAVFIVFFLFYKLYGNTEEGRLKFAVLGRKLPVLGNINELNSASQFANSMATMLSAGLPLTRAISITAKDALRGPAPDPGHLHHRQGHRQLFCQPGDRQALRSSGRGPRPRFQPARERLHARHPDGHGGRRRGDR